MTGFAASAGSALTAPPLYSLKVRRLGNGALWLAGFLSGFVIAEPAPYELYMVFLSLIWLACGLKLRREFAPLIVLMMLYIAGGVLSVPLSRNMGDAGTYIAVTGFLAITSIFYAAVLAERPERYQVIQNAYTAGAVIVAAIGIAGYFNLFPGSSYFTLFDRARGTFQDPNVFGPFLVLPTLLLLQRLLQGPIFRNLFKNLAILAPLAVLLLGIFLSFSRGAWGSLIAAFMILYTIQLVAERNPVRRLRLTVIGLSAIAAAALLLLAILSLDTVSEMFSQRARLVQDYDTARYGRFARYGLGFQMVMERPFGLGALEFHKYFYEDEHNVYLKGFTTYGWLGGLAYAGLALWTLLAFVPLLFKSRPWTAFARCVFGVFTAHLILSVIIDTDHWRHMYLLYGLAWGLIAADRLERRAIRRAGGNSVNLAPVKLAPVNLGPVNNAG